MMNAKKSLYWHFLGIIIPMIVVVFIALIGAYEWLNFSKDKDRLLVKLDHIASTYSLLLSDPIVAKRSEELQLYLISLIADPDVGYVLISDEDGNVLEQYGEETDVEVALTRAISISYSNNGDIFRVGEFRLGMTTKETVRSVMGRINYEVILLLSMIAVVLISVWIAYVRTFGKPLKALNHSITVFKSSRRHVPVEYKYDDVLGKVINRFNDMQEHQLRIQKELKNQYFSLEQTVAERTRELEEELNRHAETTSKLYSEKQRAQITLNTISDSVITTDIEGVIEFMNPSAYKLLGYKKGMIEGKIFSDVFHLLSIESRDRITDLVTWCLESENHRCPPIEFFLKTETDKEYIIEAMLTGLADVRGDVSGVVILIRDITAIKQRNKELFYLAQHDMLTGLVNRREFEVRLERMLEDARLNESHHVMFYLDLDYFKRVNDECGHAAGDKVLKLISREFQKHLRKEDCIGRLGGDEFGVLLLNCDIENARNVGEKMRQDIEDFRFNWEGKVFTLGVSIGVVAITQHSESIEEIVSKADNSCYMAKQNGRNRIHLYST